MKNVAHYVRRIAYFLLILFVLVWAEVELNIYNVEYVWHRIVIIVLLFADAVFSVDLSEVLARKFETGTFIKEMRVGRQH